MAATPTEALQLTTPLSLARGCQGWGLGSRAREFCGIRAVTGWKSPMFD